MTLITIIKLYRFANKIRKIINICLGLAINCSNNLEFLSVFRRYFENPIKIRISKNFNKTTIIINRSATTTRISRSKTNLNRTCICIKSRKLKCNKVTISPIFCNITSIKEFRSTSNVLTRYSYAILYITY